MGIITVFTLTLDINDTTKEAAATEETVLYSDGHTGG